MSEASPSKCPTCGTALEPNASRCFACGRVLGADNKCPHCHATAGVLAKDGGYVCAACSQPREKLPGTVVVGKSPETMIPHAARDAVANVSAGGIFGGLAIGAGVLMLLAAVVAFMVLPLALGTAGFVIAALMAAVGIGAGAVGFAARGGAAQKRAERNARTRELAIVDLAEKRGGDLTVLDVARELRISMAEADRALTALAKQGHVGVEVDPEGIVHYVFAGVRPKVRVEGEPEEVDAALERERERAKRV
jgi:predicted DNA-binding transcriptional regulator